ncbi:MAG: ATP synthase F0 subunit B [Proteobacteria bacterium]|nr:ATP synthase F0 subunit B [Pseudomonadota bacterium]
MTGGPESIWSWVFKFVNFFVLVGVLVRFAGKPLKDYLVNRHQTIKDKLEEAERLLREAEVLKVEYEKKIAKLDEEVDAFKKAVIAEAEKEKKKILDDAAKYASKIKEQTRLTCEQEAKEVVDKIKEEIARQTIEKAKKIVMGKLTKDDHNRMVDEFIEKLGSMN